MLIKKILRFNLTLDEIVPKSVWELDKPTMQKYKEEAAKATEVRTILRAVVLDNRLQVHPDDTTSWFYLKDKETEPDAVDVTLEAAADTPINQIPGTENLYGKKFKEVREIPVL